MKRLLLDPLSDWGFVLLMCALTAMVTAATTHSVMRDRVRATENDMCSTAFLLTRTSRDTIGLITSRNQCVRLLQAEAPAAPYDSTTPLLTEKPDRIPAP